MTFRQKDPSIHILERKWLVYDYTLTQPFELAVLRLIHLCVCVIEYLFLCVHFHLLKQVSAPFRVYHLTSTECIK